MIRYHVIVKDGVEHVVDDADTYLQEGTMTTFFSTDAGRAVVDCWSTRVASFRTSEIVIIRRVTSDEVVSDDLAVAV